MRFDRHQSSLALYCLNTFWIKFMLFWQILKKTRATLVALIFLERFPKCSDVNTADILFHFPVGGRAWTCDRRLFSGFFGNRLKPTALNSSRNLMLCCISREEVMFAAFLTVLWANFGHNLSLHLLSTLLTWLAYKLTALRLAYVGQYHKQRPDITQKTTYVCLTNILSRGLGIHTSFNGIFLHLLDDSAHTLCQFADKVPSCGKGEGDLTKLELSTVHN